MASTSEAEKTACTHLPARVAMPQSAVCQECGSKSSLRLCIECGHVGCCESQASHGQAHALEHHHPVIKSLPLDASHFTWCYECDAYV